MRKYEEFEFIFGEDAGGFGTDEANIMLVIVGLIAIFIIVVLSTYLYTIFLK